MTEPLAGELWREKESGYLLFITRVESSISDYPTQIIFYDTLSVPSREMAARTLSRFLECSERVN